jgi:hypothetical protein
MSQFGTFETCRDVRSSITIGGIADMTRTPISDVDIAGNQPTIVLYEHPISPSPNRSAS